MLTHIALIFVFKLLLVAVLIEPRRATVVKVVGAITGVIQLAAVHIVGVNVIPIKVISIDVVRVDIVPIDVGVINVRIDVAVVVVVPIHESIRVRYLGIVVVDNRRVVPASSPRVIAPPTATAAAHGRSHCYAHSERKQAGRDHCSR